MKVIEVIIYATKANKEPFTIWLDTLDKKNRATIISRLNRLQTGNFGDCTLIKGCKGIWEFRIHFGPGFRIYWGKKKETIIVLLIGGDKKSQKRDIEKATAYWLDYKESL